MKAPKDALLLIDGHALLHRAFHALPPLRTKDGLPTNALFGFTSTLLKALDDFKPKYCAVAFDLDGKTFRHRAYEGYKANRKEMDAELASQIPYAYRIAEALNIPVFTKEGYEADDVIGTLTRIANENKVPVIIATGDRDAFQLVNDQTVVFMMRRGVNDIAIYDADAVLARMQVWPRQIADYKALAGDSSDEIPGISGIGDKTAVTLLANGISLDDLYQKLKAGEQIDGISERVAQKVLAGEAAAEQSLALAKIDLDVPLEVSLDDCRLQSYDQDKVNEVFRELEFFSFLNRMLKTDYAPSGQLFPPAPPKRDWRFKALTTEAEIKAAVDEMAKAKIITVDTETDNLFGPLIGISISSTSKLGYYIPIAKEHGGQLSIGKIASLIQPLFADQKIGKVGHNIKYDLRSLASVGINLTPVVFDTMIAGYILHAHMRSFDFDTMCARELGYQTIKYSDVVGVKSKTVSLLTAPGDKVAEYAAEDAIFTLRLYQHLSQELTKEPKLKSVGKTIDFPLIEVLARMEIRGIQLDSASLNKLGNEIEEEIILLRHRIESSSPKPINVNSPAQLQGLLFDDLQLEKAGIKTTQNGVSTAAGELEKLQGAHPVVDDILRYRELTKLMSTYIKTLPELADANGRVHTQYSQATASTGRLSSNHPNLQNIPVRTELGNKIRQAFVADASNDLISLDYSQIELRIAAHLSGDKNLQKVFADGRDIHAEVAKAMNVDRRVAKTINFGVLYGQSPFGLARTLKIDNATAAQYIDAYYAAYPELKSYLDNLRREAKDKGFVVTLFGRRLEIPEIRASNAAVRQAAERTAINAPIQGTAADVIKLAMVEADEWLEKTYSGKTNRPYLLLQVHDELLLESPKAETDKVAAKIKEIMESVAKLAVPLEADVEIGPNWGELTKQS